MTLTVQLYTILAMLGTGAGMAWVYDLYTWARYKLRIRKFLTFILDVGYWIAFATMVLMVLYNVNEGRLRFTLFFAILFGGVLYFQFFSQPFLSIWDRLVLLIVQIVKFILHTLQIVLYQPVLWILMTLIGVIVRLSKGLWKVITVLTRWISRPFIVFFRRIYQLALALIRNIGKMIIQFFQKKPPDE